MKESAKNQEIYLLKLGVDAGVVGLVGVAFSLTILLKMRRKRIKNLETSLVNIDGRKFSFFTNFLSSPA